MALPIINIRMNNTIHVFPEDGNLVYDYLPFQNLKITSQTQGQIDLAPLTLNAKIANIDINKPIFLDTEISYDDSINLLINDQVNPLKNSKIQGFI